MARQAEGAPGEFAQALAREIRRETGDRRMSGRSLATVLDKSEKYVRERLNGTFSFTLNDIEAFAAHIDESPEAFVARVESDMEAIRRRRTLRPVNVGGSREADLETVDLTNEPLAASTDDSAIDPSRGEA